jgi:farnesyl diphosphate synthase
LDGARAYAQELRDRAHAALAAAGLTATTTLGILADMVVQRDS